MTEAWALRLFLAPLEWCTAALRAVRRFEVSQEQVVPKHKLLVVEIDLEMYTHSHSNGNGEACQAGGTRPEQAREGL